jgi:2-oxoglutarate ferredoxin oxidoreductase subunit alpha
MLRPQIVWPFPKLPVVSMLEKVSHVLVPEMNVGQLRKEVERLSSGIRGKVQGLNVLDPTFITAEQIVDKVRDIRMKHKSTAAEMIHISDSIEPVSSGHNRS